MRKFFGLIAALLSLSTFAADQTVGNTYAPYSQPICAKASDGTCQPFRQDAAGQVGPVNRFTCSLNALANVLTQCQALAASRIYYITDIVAQSSGATAGQFAVQSGTGAACATGTTAIFPNSGTANRFTAPVQTAAPAVMQFSTPLEIPVGHAICVIGTLTNTVNIQIAGYYSP